MPCLGAYALGRLEPLTLWLRGESTLHYTTVLSYYQIIEFVAIMQCLTEKLIVFFLKHQDDHDALENREFINWKGIESQSFQAFSWCQKPSEIDINNKRKKIDKENDVRF